MKHLLLTLTFIILMSGCASTNFDTNILKQQAPETFKARFETTQGSFEIEAHRTWSPMGVDRLYQLINSGYYTDIAIFRVVDGFVAQFGISDNPGLAKAWEEHAINDEPVVAKNKAMTIAFARDGKNSRAIQLFINLKDNPKLDIVNYNGVKGFPVIAKVISGTDVILKFHDGYGEQPSGKQDKIYKKGNTYLKQYFPKLDYIKKAYLLK